MIADMLKAEYEKLNPQERDEVLAMVREIIANRASTVGREFASAGIPVPGH